MTDETDSFKPSLGEMTDDQRDEYISFTYLQQGDLLYDDSSSESSVSDETTPQTSEYSDASDTDDDEGQYEMLDSNCTDAETTIDRLTGCVDSFLASEDEDSEVDDALEDDVTENRPPSPPRKQETLPKACHVIFGD
ncbi:hypothetical protein MTO96_026127 [Rhipicephalus appendiculatus]